VGAVGLIAVTGIVVAFLAGWRIRAASAAWNDHRDQRAKERRLRKARWSVAGAAFWPVCGLAGLAVVLVLAASR
jgi:hypothetical protein